MTERWRGIEVVPPLAAFKEGFAEWLAVRAYVPSTTGDLVTVMADLAGWMARDGLALDGLTDEEVGLYLDHRRVLGRKRACTIAGVAALTGYLREVGAPLTAPAPVSPWSCSFTEGFAQWLALDRGLSPRYVGVHASWVERFIAEAPGGTEAPGWLSAGRIEEFVTGLAGRYAATSMAIPLTALRHMIAFAVSVGACDASLSAAVPQVKRHRQLGLPQMFTPDAVADVLSGCDDDRTCGIRDAAIVALTTDLGLRTVEVARLSLDDIDWAHASVAVRGKNGLVEQMLLTQRAGEAVARWLQEGRKNTTDRSLFHTVHAPRRPLTARGVGSALRRAGERAGVEGFNARGARHSLGCAVVAGEGTLQDAAQVLRHLSMTATTIYARVEVASLRELVVPWPTVAAEVRS